MPSSLKLIDLLNNIKNTILGTETNKIDYYIDKKFNEIDIKNDRLSRNLYIDAVKDITNQKNFDSDELLEKIIDENVNILNLDETNRIQRYQEYICIVSKIPHVKRALRVLTDNIISPDNITKRVLEISYQHEINEDKFNNIIEELKLIKDELKIEKDLWNIVHNLLHKGDYFVEIIHSPKGELSHIILNEDENFYLKSKNFKQIKFEIPDLLKNLSKEDEEILQENNISFPKNIIIEIQEKENNLLKEDENKDNKFQSKFSKKNLRHKKEEKIELKDLFITYHKPEYVVRLETERFRSNLGYLVFPKIDNNQNNLFPGYDNNNANLALKGNLNFISNLSNSLEKPLNKLCKDIITYIYDKIENKELKLHKSKDLKDVIMKYLLTIKNDEDLKIRYVPPEMMIHFRLDVGKYDPYGESLLDSILFECKLYIALKTAMTIKQINASTDRRVISVEVGLSRNAKNVIEQIKEKMRKRKISIDNFGTIDSIPSQIKTFEDIYLPMLDGKNFIQFNNENSNPGIQEDVERLKFIRDNIVANLGVPPAHIGIEENTSNRALLNQESAIFARTIIAYQNQISPYFKELLCKIYKLLHKETDYDRELENITVTFPVPKTAAYEHENEFLQILVQLIQVYKDLGVPMDYLKKQYLTNIDWEQVDKLKIKNKIDTLTNPDEQNQGMGRGMAGPGMY